MHAISIACLKLIEHRNLDAKHRADLVVTIVGGNHRRKRAYNCRSLVLLITNLHQVRLTEPRDINNGELLIRKLTRNFCHRISD